MRGDVALTGRLLLRRGGLGGLLVACGGTLALVGSTGSAWRVTRARVSMLGGSQDGLVEVVRGFPSTVPGSLAAVLALPVLVLGVMIALDRPPPRAPRLAAGAALAWLGLATAGLLRTPTPPGAPAADPLTTVGSSATTLPVGVELEVVAGRGIGPGLLAAAALVTLLGALVSREP